MAIKTFQRFGRGVFKCQCCKRSTRETNRDHAQTGNCAECFELAGIENAISDADDKAETIARYRDEALRHIARIEQLGGSLENWTDLIAEVKS